MSSHQSAAALRSLALDGPDEPPRVAVPLPRYPWRTRVAVPVGITIALVALAGWSAKEALLPVTEVRVVPVVLRPAGEASPVAGGTLAPSGNKGSTVTAQAAGWIEPDPYAMAAAALTDGTVRDIIVLEGQAVRAGDVLVRLIDDDAKLAVARAEADLGLRRAEAEAAQRRWDHPIELKREVAVTTACADETKAELERLVSEIAAEEAREKELADLLRRIEPMVAAQAASELELQSTRFRLEAQRATLAAMKARQPVLDAQLRRRTAEAAAAAQNAELRIEDKRLLDTANAAVRVADAQLSEARLRLERTAVRSPADGVVMSLLVEPGTKLMLAADSPTSAYVARLYDPAKLQVRVDVPLSDAPKVAIESPAEVLVESLPNRTLRGEVTRVVHQADVAKNTLQFKVRLLETVPDLKPEMLARVKFLARPPAVADADSFQATSSESGSHRPFIPESLVRRDGETTSVVTVDRAAGVVRVRTITLGRTRHDGWVAVIDGLAAGDVLIADPPSVSDGQRVRVAGEFDGPLAKEGR